MPFYYAPRSPMMHNIHKGKVPSYQDGCERLIYLATTHSGSKMRDFPGWRLTVTLY
ncbi:DUF4433 domain-containing protein [Kribbella qitaiheensis]|uniref:DUF4433 domain-containing protein n=1 Tax=Kribbella qitaiheensis TaxID=1544730 RepID=A0A7G6X199_9ACTN|nr:DUF4433 domain-containing protein [Kribbella qitaiheensis]